MNKFKKGDTVVYIAAFEEQYDDQYVIGKQYKVENPKYMGGIKLQGLGTDGEELVYMQADNFRLYTAPPAQQGVFNVGDEVIYTGKIYEMFQDDYTKGQTYVVAIPAYQDRSDRIKVKDLDGKELVWMLTKNFKHKEKPVVPNKNGSHGKLWLQVATFHDRQGNKTVVKRSPCRHYYIKTPGKAQKRVNKDGVRQLLADAASTI